MNATLPNPEQQRLQEARESYAGRLLSDSQFAEAISITKIIEREIHKSGVFKEKLGDYAHAFARNERFIDPAKAESTVRDLFKIRTGQTMNQLRETLTKREVFLLGRDGDSTSTNTAPNLSEVEKQRAIEAAQAAGRAVQDGDKMTFYRARAQKAAALGNDLGITENAASRLMQDTFKAVEQRDLSTWGKEVEKAYYRPQIEAEMAERKTARSQNPSPARQRTRG